MVCDIIYTYKIHIHLYKCSPVTSEDQGLPEYVQK